MVTDHASLSWLQNLKEPEGRLACWALKLQPYNFTIVHCPSNTHQNADGLSQSPTIAHLLPEADRLYNLLLDPVCFNEESPEVQAITKKLSNDTTVEDGTLYKLVDGDRKLFARPSERIDLIMDALKHIGHGGTRKTIKELQNQYYWESMSKDVHKTISACVTCQK